MDTSPKLQKAGRAFLLRLVAEDGPDQAVRILRDLADEIEGLAEEQIEAAGACRWRIRSQAAIGNLNESRQCSCQP